MITIHYFGDIERDEIDERIKLIECSDTDYVSESGNIYKLMRNNLFFKKKTHVNKHNGYIYCGITQLNRENKSMRVHRLVAEAFVDNPYDLDIVGHKNNVKHDNYYKNLIWTTTSENTQKAHDDGLLVNDKGINDSQSIHIACYSNDDVLVGVYGSIREAGRYIEGTSASAIHKVLDKTKHGLKGYYYVSITSDFYRQHEKTLGQKRIVTQYMPKKRRNFLVVLPCGTGYLSNNQSEVARKEGVHQTGISLLLNSPNKKGLLGDIWIELI